MSDQAVVVKIGANIEQLRSGAREASGHIESLTSKLKEFKSEQVGQFRTARFFAAELQEIGLGADVAKGALRDLIAVGLSGGGIVMAFEGALFVLKRLHDHFKENEEAAKKLKETAEKLDDALLKIRDSFGPPKSATQQAWLDWLRPIHKEMDAIQKKIDDIIEAGKLVPEIGASAEAVAGGPMEKKTALAGVIEEGTGKRDTTEADERRDKARKKDAEEGKRLREQGLQDLIKSIDDQLAEETRGAAALLEIQKKEAADAKKLLDQGTKDLIKSIDDQLAAEVAGMLAENKARDEQAKKARHQEQQHAEDLKATADQIGASFSSAFKSMIHGVKSFDEAMKDLAMGLLDMAIDLIFKTIAEQLVAAITGVAISKVMNFKTTQANIATAASGAAASVAFIPFVGPVLGAAAAKAMVANLEALTGPLLSAAGGFDIPTGDNPLVRLHAREMVLPAEIANPLREQLAGGGGGGDVHAHFHIGGPIDGDSFRRFVESDGFRRAMREAKRNGLMP
jgi:hypothetical protein